MPSGAGVCSLTDGMSKLPHMPPPAKLTWMCSAPSKVPVISEDGDVTVPDTINRLPEYW